MKNAALQEVKQAIRAPFAFPGGYALTILMADCELMCINCARENFRQIARATRAADSTGWQAMGSYVHWEGAVDHCCHCGKELPAEYSDPYWP